MPIIKRRPKEILKPITFRLPESLIAKLADFSDYVNVPQAEIVAAAIAYAIESDKEFSTECTQSAISGTQETQQRRTSEASDADSKSTSKNTAVSA